MSEHCKYEKSRIIGARALQITEGAPLLIKLSKKELEELNYSAFEVAKLEYEKGVIPIDVEKHK